MHRPRIRLVAVGGCGCNALFRLGQLEDRGFDLVAVVTEPRELEAAYAAHSRLMSRRRYRDSEVDAPLERGRRAVGDVEDRLSRSLRGTAVCFVVAGLGGGTGTGGAPEIARIAKAEGALTIGIAYLPFESEGTDRLQVALDGVHALRERCDQVILLSNQRLLRASGRRPLDLSFRALDELAARGMVAIASPLFRPETSEMKMHDLRGILTNGGLASVGYGESYGSPSSLATATETALQHPFLHQGKIEEARGALMWGVTDRPLGPGEGDHTRRALWSRLPLSTRTLSGWAVDESPSMQGRSMSTVLLTGLEPSSHLAFGGPGAL